VQGAGGAAEEDCQPNDRTFVLSRNTKVRPFATEALRATPGCRSRRRSPRHPTPKTRPAKPRCNMPYSALTSAPPGANPTRRTSPPPPPLAAGRLAPQRSHHRPGLLPVAPEQHRGSGARDRRADRPQLRGPLHQLHRPRVQVPPVRLVEPVREAAPDEREV